ncbi:Hypothetical protein FKW44_007593, partial [Caligus rogercresseyi]
HMSERPRLDCLLTSGSSTLVYRSPKSSPFIFFFFFTFSLSQKLDPNQFPTNPWTIRKDTLRSELIQKCLFLNWRH